MRNEAIKSNVHDYWKDESCGENYSESLNEREFYSSQEKTRYALEPYIFDFAKFQEGTGKDIFEIGVGMGADHLQWAKSAPNSLSGIDLTMRAIQNTKARLSLDGYSSNLQQADAENLPFENDQFDIVYSWGVIHHSPDTPRIAREIYRTLRKTGKARVMVYNKHSITGFLLWLRYGMFRGKNLTDVYAKYLQAGTKAYTPTEATEMFRSSGFSEVKTTVYLSIGDTLEGKAGKQHQGTLLSMAKLFWPRWFIKKFMGKFGLFLAIEANK